MIIGGDIGHKNVKLAYGLTENERLIFRSTTKEGSDDLLGVREDGFVIKYDRKEYTIGSFNGAYSVEDDKSNDENFRLCLFAGIARVMTKDIDNVNLVTGLPINYYKKYKQLLEDSLEGQSIKIIYSQRTRIMNFNKVKVFPESVGLPIIYPELKGSVLIIDIGGRTVDVSCFENGKLVLTGSYDLGMLTVYSQIAKHINGKHGTDYSPLDAERIISEGNFVADNIEVSFDSTRFLQAHTQAILNPIKLDFPWKKSKKIFIGGGAIDLKDFLPKSYKDVDCIYSNAEAFYRIGVDQYGG